MGISDSNLQKKSCVIPSIYVNFCFSYLDAVNHHFLTELNHRSNELKFKGSIVLSSSHQKLSEILQLLLVRFLPDVDKMPPGRFAIIQSLQGKWRQKFARFSPFHHIEQILQRISDTICIGRVGFVNRDPGEVKNLGHIRHGSKIAMTGSIQSLQQNWTVNLSCLG